LSFTVPGGWSVIDDTATWFALLYAPDAPPGKGSGELFVAILTAPRAAADVPARAACDSPVADAPGVGGRADDLVAAIRARPGVISTLQTPVTIDGHDGRVLDLEFASSWTGGCQAPDGTEGGVAVLHEAGSATGPVVGVGPDYPVRVILMDLSEDRTLAIVIRDVGPVQRSRFEAHVAAAMPIINSFQFDSRSP
jgi:hypothetical protein